MKADEVIEQLNKLIEKHGDRDVYFSYDGGILVPARKITYHKSVLDSPYYNDPETLKKVFIINYSTG